MIEIFRHTYNTKGDRNIIGDLFIDGKFFCYTLEDELRQEKVYGLTAIPSGEYYYEITYSPRFKRQMILIKDVSLFSGIRIHGGNTSKDSHGCPLVAFNTDYKKIWGTAEKKLTKLIQETNPKGKIIITNNPFTYDKINHKLYEKAI